MGREDKFLKVNVHPKNGDTGKNSFDVENCDCMIGVVSNAHSSDIHGVFFTACSGLTLYSAVRSIVKVLISAAESGDEGTCAALKAALDAEGFCIKPTTPEEGRK